MATNNHAPLRSISTVRWIILIGLSVTAAGILASFQLERHSFVETRDFEFRFLSEMFLPVLALGLLTTLTGSVLWARRAAIRDLVVYGLGTIILIPLALALIPINVHDWTAVFMFVGLAGVLIGSLFLVFAFGRAIVHRRAKSR
jgi:hypothetical protein